MSIPFLRSSFPIASALLALALAGAGFTPARAASYTWVPSGTATWDAANWGGVAPTFSDTAVINNSGTATIATGVSGSYREIHIGRTSGGSGALSLTGGLLGNGSSFAYVGTNVDSAGAVTVASGTWTNNELIVGYSGRGSLLVNGGVVNSTSASVGMYYSSLGTDVTVTSGTFAVINSLQVGSGSMRLNGGYVSTGNGILGSGGPFTASIFVSSGTWSSSTLLVGDLGRAEMQVSGGLVQSNNHTIGNHPTFGQGSLLVTGGTVATALEFMVGNAGTGSLRIDGGQVSSASATIGGGSGLGAAVVDSGTWTVGSNLRVGASGTGSLVVNGGSVVLSGTLGVGTATFGRGSVTVNGGELRGAKAAIAVAEGESSVTLTGGVMVFTDTVTVGVSGTGSLLITGGELTSAAGVVGSSPYGRGVAALSGQGAVWEIEGNLTVGANFVANNTLTISNQALVKVGDQDGEGLFLSSGNYLRLSLGYLALYGDQTDAFTALLDTGRVQMWDGDEWIQATLEGVGLTYYAADAFGEQLAFEQTGYEGLGGYTVATAIPEPAAAALIILGGSLALPRRRNSRS